MSKDKKKKKKVNSVLIQALRVEPRPGQPLFSLIVFGSFLLDLIRTVLKTIVCLIVIFILSVGTVSAVAYVNLKPEYDAYMENARKTV